MYKVALQYIHDGVQCAELYIGWWLVGGKDGCLQVQGQIPPPSRGGALAHGLDCEDEEGGRLDGGRQGAEDRDDGSDGDEVDVKDDGGNEANPEVKNHMVMMVTFTVMMVISIMMVMITIHCTMKQTWKRRTTYPHRWLADQL